MIIECPYCHIKLGIILESWSEDREWMITCDEQHNIYDTMIDRQANRDNTEDQEIIKRDFCGKSIAMRSECFQPLVFASTVEFLPAETKAERC